MIGCCTADKEPQNWLTYAGSYKSYAKHARPEIQNSSIA